MTELFRKAEASGITVEYCRIPMNKSVSVQDDSGDFILMDYSLIEAGAKERVHLAHELGHCKTGSFYSPKCKYDIRKKHENRADKWAIKELIPEERFWTEYSRCRSLQSLAEVFSVTEEFMRKALCWYLYGNLAVEMYVL